MSFSPGHRKSILWLTISYWTLLLVIGTFSTIFNGVAAGFVTMTCIFFVICLPVSFKLSGLTLSKWYHEVLLTGVERIAFACSQMTRPDPKV